MLFGGGAGNVYGGAPPKINARLPKPIMNANFANAVLVNAPGGNGGIIGNGRVP